MSLSHYVLTLAALSCGVTKQAVYASPPAPLGLRGDKDYAVVSQQGAMTQMDTLQQLRADIALQHTLMRQIESERQKLQQQQQQQQQQSTPTAVKTQANVPSLESTFQQANVFSKPAPVVASFPAAAATGAFPAGSGDTILVSVMFGVLLAFDILMPFTEYKLSNHVRALGFMVMASGIFCAFVCYQEGKAGGVAWATGYALEWALSMDNLFVFHLVFKAFSVPNEHAMKALRLGIYGAIFFRVIFILFLTHLLELSYWVNVALGCVLILSGFISLQEDDDDEVQNMPTVRFFKWLAGPRLLDTYSDDGSFFTRSADGKLQMTVLFLVVCVVAVIDCIFAVDSVGAKTGQIKNIYINLTSSLMGMFSLRSLFFIVRDMADYFDYVKYGICSILCFIGVEMIISKWVTVPLMWSCAVVCIVFVASVAASIIKVIKVGGNGRGPIKSLTVQYAPQAPNQPGYDLQPKKVIKIVAERRDPILSIMTPQTIKF